jgi:hypothetical protein
MDIGWFYVKDSGVIRSELEIIHVTPKRKLLVDGEDHLQIAIEYQRFFFGISSSILQIGCPHRNYRLWI